ncbi:GNAT family N-acetyltransferase [Aquimarina sp. I32.4]|uniref:GNAT family N-acetyltransferase n=1 Tax=Aquimarina sp. I32.4 TaxID=2053903 RepID=UPI000CDE8D66|nr:GNAT family N-acetyltransferase [Aquimarina sp. I32.4]
MDTSKKEIILLDWDSNFFGMKVGKLHLYNEELPSIKITDFDLVYIHSSKLLKNTHIPCYDKKVTFKKLISAKRKNITNQHIITYNGKLTKELLNLSLASGAFSRFKLDPRLSSYFKELYTLWIQNSLNGQLADHVFIYKKENEIIGFITLKKKENYFQIGLIATSHNHRGIGIGSSLLNKVENTVLSEGYNEIRVVSQLDNSTACKFYQKNNYIVDEIEYIHHHHKQL